MKILIADDSAVVRSVVKNLLLNDNHEIVEAEDGVEAIQQFYATNPDLVLMDLQMPRMNGYVACRVLKEDRNVQIPVFILTAHDTPEDRYWGEKSGADRYLTKDALGTELLAAVHSVRASQALSELTLGPVDNVTLDTMGVLTRVCEVLDRKLFEMTIVNELLIVPQAHSDAESAIDDVLTIIRRLVDFQVAGIGLIERGSLYVQAASPITDSELSEFQARVAKTTTQFQSDLPFSSYRIVRTESHSGEVGGSGQRWDSFLCLPLRSQSRLMGVYAVASYRSGLYTPEILKSMRALETPLAAVLDSAQSRAAAHNAG